MSILHLFKLSYYIDSFADPDFKLLWPLVILLGLVLITVIIGQRRFNKLNRNLSGDQKFWWTHWLNIGYTISIVGLFHLFIRYENIPYLNWRLWPTLVILGVASWIIYLIYYRRIILPKKQAEREERKGVATYFRRRHHSK